MTWIDEDEARINAEVARDRETAALRERVKLLEDLCRESEPIVRVVCPTLGERLRAALA